jgi:hypothetical protein
MKKYQRNSNLLDDYSVAEQRLVYVPQFSIQDDVILANCAQTQLAEEFHKLIWRKGENHV